MKKLSDGTYMVFVTKEHMKPFHNCERLLASTERFLDGDIPLYLEEHEVGDVSHGGTIVVIQKGGVKEE
jgi:hypothetical protein